MLNTRITYLYTDAANYKTSNVAVIPGILTSEQQAQILDSLDDGEFFVPHAVGLPEDRGGFAPDPDLDHGWFRLSPGFAEPTDADATVDVAPDVLTAAFVRTGPNGWDRYLR